MHQNLFDMTHTMVRLMLLAGGLGGAIGSVLMPAPALATGIACIRCTEPEKIYRCHALSEAPLTAPAVEMFCAARIAGEYVHRSCAVQRGISDCEGFDVSYAYEEGAALGERKRRDRRREEQWPAKNEPQTLGEFTKDTVKGSADAVKKAGENLGNAASKAGKATTDAIEGAGAAIGNATKKTLKCLGSALNDC